MATAMLRTMAPDQPLPAWRGWLPLALLPLLALSLVPASWPRWALMWLLIAAIFLGFKWATWRRTPAVGVPLWRQLSYLLLWLGLDAPTFLGSDRKDRPAQPAIAEWLLAAFKLALGISLLWIVTPRISLAYPLLVGWVGLTGIAFTLHFGALHLLSCAWRAQGIHARPIMDWPIAATGLADFWGRRWNTAFRDLTHRIFFRPVLRRWGATGAVVAGFVFSGLIHDVALSLPAGGGYGWPTSYFLLQCVAVFFERSSAGKRLGLCAGWRGWLFTMLVVLGPAYFLFHPPFMLRVAIPFLQVIGAAATA
jgi:alginate O-acetyltransferase complex protein AlgI